jgi:hypothetical protein
MLARARGRVDAYELAKLGVPAVRETWGSALEAGEHALRLLGHRPFVARSIAHRFRKHDEKQFEETMQVLDDRDKLLAVVAAHRVQLEKLLQDDAEEIARAKAAGRVVDW